MQALDDYSSVQIAVVTVESLSDFPARAYAVRLLREWGVGQRGLNNGALVLVAPNEREVFVAVGTGLEWQIPDAEASAAIAQMTPHFRSGDYADGLRAGIAALDALASAVSWDVRYRRLADLPERRTRAVGAVAVVRGVLSTGGNTVQAEGELVALRFPAYWEPSVLRAGAPVTLLGRIASVEPLTVEVLGVTD